MRTTILKLLTTTMIFSSIAFGGESEPLDEVIIARKITSEMEASFDGKDNSKYSNFWEIWLNNKDKIDYVNMIPDRNGWRRGTSPFTSSEDATLNVYAAWGIKGIYLLFEAFDDQSCSDCITCLVDTAGKQYCPKDPTWLNDAIDVFIDKYSTSRQLITLNETFLKYDFDRRTRTMVQIQFQFGTNDNATTFCFNRFDPAKDKMDYQTYDFTYAANNLDGLIMKTVKTDSPNHKFQEWFIPWSQVGNNGGFPAQLRVVGEKFGLVLGYNDADAGATAYDALRWKNQADPTKRIPADSASVCQLISEGKYKCIWKDIPIDSWCNFQLGASIETTNTIKPKPLRFNDCQVKKLEFYTIKGSKINTENGRFKAAKGAIVLERALLANNKYQTNVKFLGEK